MVARRDTQNHRFPASVIGVGGKAECAGRVASVQQQQPQTFATQVVLDADLRLRGAAVTGVDVSREMPMEAVRAEYPEVVRAAVSVGLPLPADSVPGPDRVAPRNAIEMLLVVDVKNGARSPRVLERQDDVAGPGPATSCVWSSYGSAREGRIPQACTGKSGIVGVGGVERPGNSLARSASSTVSGSSS